MANPYGEKRILGTYSCRWCGKTGLAVSESVSCPGRLGFVFCPCGRVSSVRVEDIGRPVKRAAVRVQRGAAAAAAEALARVNAKPLRRKAKARRDAR